MPCNSPSVSGSPCPTSILSDAEPDDDDMQSLLKDLEDPTTPPISPQIPSGQLEVRIYYGTILARTEYIDCSKGACRIVAGSSYTSQKVMAHCNDHLIELPESHPQAVSKDIFGAMGNGIVLEVIEGRIYVTPSCQTIVYCSNSASPSQEALQINKDQPTKVFDYSNHFRPSLEHYAILQGQSPSPSFFLGLGQNFGQGRNVTQNLISVMVTHCKAKQDIDTIMLPPEILGGMHDNVHIDQPTATDLEAEAFLNNLQKISN